MSRHATLSERVAGSASRVLERRVARRNLLTRTAMAGSALAVNPLGYALRPGTAYQAICTCNGQSCDCNDLCCDGYTEFCCTLTGENACPPGSIIAGWWKADGSGLCVRDGVDQPRYYMDCNATAAGPCGPSGVTSATNDCSCGCMSGSCGNRRSCCTSFRYGQCHNEVACLGPIVCRVVSCAAPWTLEPTCTTTVATDNFTRTHDRPCLHTGGEPGRPTPARGSLPLVVHGSHFYRGFDRSNDPLKGQPSFVYGNAGDQPLMGDWNADGVWSPAVVQIDRWYLRNTNSTGTADAGFQFGSPGDIPVVGDWDGDGGFGPGVVHGNTWYLRNHPVEGEPDHVFTYGDIGDIPIVGDWTGSGRFTPGVVRGNQWFLRTENSSGIADISFVYGDVGDIPVVGDWNGDGVYTPGVVRGDTWYVRNSNTTGVADEVFTFAPPVPLEGRRYLTWRAS